MADSSSDESVEIPLYNFNFDAENDRFADSGQSDISLSEHGSDSDDAAEDNDLPVTPSPVINLWLTVGYDLSVNWHIS